MTASSGSKRKARSAKPMGRPKGSGSKWTEAIAAEIAERISQGEPLAQICRDERMPGLSTVYDWMDERPDFAGRIARARIAGYDMIAQEALAIADTPAEGVVEKLEPNEAGQLCVVERRREDMLGHRKLQVETRLKLLAKWDPKRYGERQTIEMTVRPAEELTDDELARIASGGGTA